MLETSARLLRLLSLMQSRRDWTGAELAGRLGVGLRTVRRDIDRLRDLGYPVDATPGATGGYRLGVGAALPPLLLDDEEAVAVAISLHMATTGSVAGLEGDRATGADQAPADAAVPAPVPDHRVPCHHGPADRAGIRA
jgi:predicted DNA-binding transcriptional regulator YafY